MEKSAFKLLIFFLLFTTNMNAQDSLCVFKLNGHVFNKIDSIYVPLKKGSYILSKQTITVEENTSITSIDNQGKAYQIQDSGDYDFKSILKKRIEDKQSNLTIAYFKFIWDEISNKESNTAIIGGVHRGETRMIYPYDNSYIVDDIIKFQWEIDSLSSTSFFFLKKKESQELLLKFATNSTNIRFYEENDLFHLGNEYEWSISSEEYPDINNLPFYGFKIITRKDYEDKKLKYMSLIKDLKALKFSDNDIDTILCETYKVCK